MATERRINCLQEEYELACKIALIMKDHLHSRNDPSEELDFCAVKTFVETMVNRWGSDIQ